jgi:2,3-dihydroxybenzoate decarboxylase
MTDRDYLRIATEEAFAPPEPVAEWQAMLNRGDAADPGFISQVGFYMTNHSERTLFIKERLQDLGRLRLADMDAAGIDRQIISLTCPGVQATGQLVSLPLPMTSSPRLAAATPSGSPD